MKNIGFFMHNRGRYFVQQLKAGAGADTDAPSIPANLAASSITATTLTLTWDPSTDNVGVVSYEVEQAVGAGAFAWLATVAHPTVTLAVSGLDPAGVYRFRVRAIDAAGNMSGWGPSDAGLTVDMFTFVAPAFDGEVRVVTPDGHGGYYVGGSFLNVTDANGTHARARICHIDRNGLVTSWDPGSDQTVWAIFVKDADFVFVGKNYNATLTNNTLGGFDCRGAGQVHRVTGIATSWDPAVLGAVTCFARSGQWLYMGVNISATQHSRRVDIDTLVGSAWGYNSLTTANFVWAIAVTTTGLIFAQEDLPAGWTKQTEAIPSVNVAGFAPAKNTGGFSSWNVGLIPLDSSRLLLFSQTLTSLNSGAQAVKGMGIVNNVTGAAEAWQQDLNLGSNGVTRAGYTPGKVAGCFNNNLRVYDETTGTTLARFTSTGNFTSGGFGFGNQPFQFPRPDRLIVFGNSTAITANSGGSVLSGTSRMFVLALT